MTTAHACGKVILFGEHAVVYGQPAIAVPVTEVRATASVTRARPGEGITLVARDLDLRHRLGSPSQKEETRPLERTVRNTLDRIGVLVAQDLLVDIWSTIPIARGMGSGAAVATAMVRALDAHFGAGLETSEVSELVYQTELIHHGTPSGIDNSVIAFETPVYFAKDDGPRPFEVGGSFSIIVADSGVSSSTREVVSDVRRARSADPGRYDRLFAEMGALAREARDAMAGGAIELIGRLMDRNQALLADIGVSSPEIEKLVEAARKAGAVGAKLSGAGRGGNVIALVSPRGRQKVEAALRAAGAARVIATRVA
jgi:mevalonate kinase